MRLLLQDGENLIGRAAHESLLLEFRPSASGIGPCRVCARRIDAPGRDLFRTFAGPCSRGSVSELVLTALPANQID